MKKTVRFLGKTCVAFNTLHYGRFWNYEEYGIMEYKGEREYAKRGQNGEWIVRKEKEVAIEWLESGRGIYRNGWVCFEKKETPSYYYRNFEKKWLKDLMELPVIDRVLIRKLKDISALPMVKSMLNLHGVIFSFEEIEKRISPYLSKKEDVAELLQILHEGVA